MLTRNSRHAIGTVNRCFFYWSIQIFCHCGVSSHGRVPLCWPCQYFLVQEWLYSDYPILHITQRVCREIVSALEEKLRSQTVNSLTCLVKESSFFCNENEDICSFLMICHRSLHTVNEVSEIYNSTAWIRYIWIKYHLWGKYKNNIKVLWGKR